MENNKIKWASIQPLTGGMYLGAAEAIGHDAEWIMSYDGLDDIKYDKNNNIVKVGNEYHLREYLRQHGRNVPYYKIMERSQFASDVKTTDVKITLNGEEQTPDYTDLDLVVAVPVCSGLSIVSNASQGTKDSKNCNMLWITHYVLTVIQPKVYCFENAPTLVTDRGRELRQLFENLAANHKYSVLYYKTDTVLHENCQRRPRTFVIFFKWQADERQLPPQLNYVKDTIQIPEYFDSISKDAPQQITVKSQPHNYMLLDYYEQTYGTNWPDKFSNFNLLYYLWENKTINDFINFVKNGNYNEKDKEKSLKYIKHMISKKEQDKNYYSQDICLFKDLFPSVQFRSIPNMLHYKEKRLCTIREYLSLMGMPEDFILYGDNKFVAQIGQNVPVKTAKYIVSEIVKVLNNFNNIIRTGEANAMYQDNVKQNLLILER